MFWTRINNGPGLRPCLFVKAELNDVAVLDNIGLAFQPQLSLLLCTGKTLAIKEVLPVEDLAVRRVNERTVHIQTAPHLMRDGLEREPGARVTETHRPGGRDVGMEHVVGKQNRHQLRRFWRTCQMPTVITKAKLAGPGSLDAALAQNQNPRHQ